MAAFPNVLVHYHIIFCAVSHVMRNHSLYLLFTVGCTFQVFASAATVPVPIVADDDLIIIVPQPGLTLWQLRSDTKCEIGGELVNCGQQINSYVIRTGRENKLIVIDGGIAADASDLRNFLQALGGHVHMWFVSHQHPDHIGALTEILQENAGPQVEHIYASLLTTSDIPDDSEDFQYEQGIVAFDAARAGKSFTDLQAGNIFVIDGTKIEILGVKNPGLTAGNDIINNSSVVMRVSDGARSVLFTGDLGTEGADVLLGTQYAFKLKSRYVQMAHHGNGANTAFYEAVGAKYCLWPTTDSLWDLYTVNTLAVETEDRCGPTETSGRHYRLSDSSPFYYLEIP